jgi:DNA (cytosine-5)-methyltransferase 1
MYGRLRWDEPAQTVTSGYGSIGQGRYGHPSEPRTLTPQEAARLQLLPDFFDFTVVQRRKDWATMIGNAAPMKLSCAFVMEMLR